MVVSSNHLFIGDNSEFEIWAWFWSVYPFWVDDSLRTWKIHHYLPMVAIGCLLPIIHLVGDSRKFEIWGIFWGLTPIFLTVNFRDFSEFCRGIIACHFLPLSVWFLWDFKFKRAKDHHFTLITHTSLQVEFFHSLFGKE